MPYKKLLPRLEVLSTPPPRYRAKAMDGDWDPFKVINLTTQLVTIRLRPPPWSLKNARIKSRTEECTAFPTEVEWSLHFKKIDVDVHDPFLTGLL